VDLAVRFCRRHDVAEAIAAMEHEQARVYPFAIVGDHRLRGMRGAASTHDYAPRPA
jgi:hypothetical protein